MSNESYISQEFQGQNRILALWPEGAPTHDANTKKQTVAYSVASKTADLLGKLEGTLSGITNNKELSELGQRKQRETEGAHALKVLGAQLKRIKDDSAIADRLEKNAVQDAIGDREKDDVRGTLIDLEIAKHLKAMDPSKLIAQLGTDTMDGDLLYVAATMPAILTGLKPEQVARAKVNAVYRHDPTKAAMNQVEGEARQAAYSAIEKAYKLIAAGVPHDKRKDADIQLYRTMDATATPVMDGIHERLAGKANAETA